MKILPILADYGCFPLWREEGEFFDNIDPKSETLNLSTSLAEDLDRWSLRFDATLNQEYPPGSGFESDAEEERFVQEGRNLAERVAAELGGEWAVTYRYVRDNGAHDEWMS